MRENMDQKKSEYGYFSRSENLQLIKTCFYVFTCSFFCCEVPYSKTWKNGSVKNMSLQSVFFQKKSSSFGDLNINLGTWSGFSTTSAKVAISNTAFGHVTDTPLVTFSKKILFRRRTTSNDLDSLSLIAIIHLVIIQLIAYQQLHDKRLFFLILLWQLFDI